MAKQDYDGLLIKAQQFGARIFAAAKKNENVLLLCHHDADGIVSAAIVSQFIYKQRGHCEIRSCSEPNSLTLQRIGSGNYDLVVFLDIGAGHSREITKSFGDRWLVINHEIIPQDEWGGEIGERILNPIPFGFDGSKEACCASICYALVEKARDSHSAFFAVVGALGEGQDVGPKRSLVGLNKKILEEEALTFKEIVSKVDFLFYGRETRPVHESLANSTSIFIQGLTGNKDACLASLRSAGIDLKFNGRWKTILDFGEDEKKELLEAIVPHLSGTTTTVEDLVGTVYCLQSEDEYSLLRDARDFALILNACGRMGKPGVALSICLGRSSELQIEVDHILSEYRTDLVRSVQTMSTSAERTLDRSKYSIFVGDGIIGERMTGAVCQVLASLNRSRTKAVFLRTTTDEGDVKVSARRGKDSDEVNLGTMLYSLAVSAGGIGGGHLDRAGGRFSISRQQEFELAVDMQFRSQRSD